ncbi:hypothetical protein GCM10009574_014810 [Streptomyces asiaticus]|uniref:Uncharacterized protein n=2 Tax=Streptomyces rhizosphaericus TaxID=114699 RepID=A0ABP4BAB6_9ACTN
MSSIAMGIAPLKGKSKIAEATTATGGAQTAIALPVSRFKSHPAPRTRRNSPATGLARVARALNADAGTKRRLEPTRPRQDTSARVTPSAKVERPDATFAQRDRTARSAGHNGRLTPLRTNTRPMNHEAMIPAPTVTVRTPRRAINCGAMTL